jgi:argininosuccinate lyase
VTLTGRIDGVPSEVWHDEVLAPQFAYEVSQLLPWYVAIEKVLLLEYQRMGLASLAEIWTVARRLHEITPELVRADPRENMSDIAFAIERHASMPSPPFPAWHVDRSRNDLQATAQALAGRERLLSAVAALLRLGRAAGALAGRYLDTPMPGYTHLQAAQVISPGFYLSALGAETLRTLRRLRLSYAEVDVCPLGAGAMAGQELAWDRDRMASLLGFAGPAPHALVAVASRGWALSVAGDLSGYGVALSRFATDLMAWGSSGYGFIDLPDELSGISSAMPQKKNFPILERIRGRSAHLIGLGNDLAIAQRATPYTNMVEVSKESSAHLATLFNTLLSTLRLFTAVLAHLEFRTDRMRAACEQDYLGGFTLANLLTLRAGVPWRTAQVLAGRYIVAAMERGLRPGQPDGELLGGLASAAGHPVDQPGQLLGEAFQLDGALRAKSSAGSTHPASVGEMLAAQAVEYHEFEEWHAARRTVIDTALAVLDKALSLS